MANDEPAVTREERLIQRALDGDATSGEWQELELLASGDVGVWERLAWGLRVVAPLRVAVDEAVELAETIELPSPVFIARRHRRGPRVWVGASGWAAAAVFALLWLGPWLADSDSTPTRDGEVAMHPVADPGDSPDADAIFADYLDTGMNEGRVVRELPRRVVSTQPAREDGQGVEVVYVRRILERAVVDQFYAVGEDDQGRPTSVPVSSTRLVGYGNL